MGRRLDDGSSRSTSSSDVVGATSTRRFFGGRGLARLRRQWWRAGGRRAGVPAWPASGSARRSPGRTRSSASARTIATTPPRPARPFRTSRSCSPSRPNHAHRPVRRRAHPARVDQDRTGRWSWASWSAGGPATWTRSRRLADAIAGFLVVNDVSERAFQLERGGQWSKGKSAETFNPAGPWLVTPDESRRRRARSDMWLDVNGVRRQTGNTDDALRPVLRRALPEPVPGARARRPHQHRNAAGVGMGFQPPVWLQPGDVMELGIEGLGTQRQTVLAPR